MKGEEDYGLLILYPLLFSITYDTILFILCLSILTKRPLFLHLVTDPGAPYSINTEDFFFSPNSSSFIHLFNLLTMAGYFSNHSQFQTRFANAASSTTTTTATVTTPPAETRPRPPTSRHFSTSVAHPPHEERDRGVDVPAPLPVHPLRNTYVRGFFLIPIRD